MTELMKQPNDLRKSFYKKTGESPIVDFSLDCSDDSYFKPQKIEVPAIEYMKYLEDMVLALKAQLTWRPVSEKPKEGQIVFVMVSTGWVVAQYLNGVFYIDDGFTFGDLITGVTHWLSIPPAPEEKV